LLPPPFFIDMLIISNICGLSNFASYIEKIRRKQTRKYFTNKISPAILFSAKSQGLWRKRLVLAEPTGK